MYEPSLEIRQSHSSSLAISCVVLSELPFYSAVSVRSLKILLEEEEEDGGAGGPLPGAHWERGALQGSSNSLLQGQRT